MSSSDSTFSIEVSIEEFISFIKCKEFNIECTFCDVFILNIKDPRKKEGTKLIPKSTVRSLANRKDVKQKLQAAQHILFSCDTSNLILKMESFPMIISLRKRSMTRAKQFGFTEFFWGKPYLDFVRKIIFDKRMVSELKTTKDIIIFNEKTKQKIASFKASVKLSMVRHFGTVKHIKANYKTLQSEESQEVSKKEKLVESHFIRNNEALNSLVKSTTELYTNRHIPVIRAKSSPNIEASKHLNMLNYIFGCGNGPHKKQVYYVGYFTVESEKNDVGASHDKSEKANSSESICAFNSPNEVKVSQCKQIECENRTHRDVPAPREPQVLLNLDNMYSECCAVNEKIEEVVGGVKAKMQFGSEPCFCTCECTFGFTKKTTYCGVCGGYEKIGEDLAHKPKLELPVACPIFHKTFDKNKMKVLSTSGSDSSRKRDSPGLKTVKTASKSGTSSDKRSVIEKKSGSEKDRKKNPKKIKDDRFKFNYGYKAPQIGHSHCAMPCSGTLGVVPKRMGWLWTAQDQSGVKVLNGWKPGAISKRLLKKLNEAKRSKSVVEEMKQTKRTKKRYGHKPTLIISKKDGEYRIQMQALAEGNDATTERYSPVIYRIAKADNEDRKRKKDRITRRLARRAVKDILPDSYDPKACNNVCLEAYKQAVGLPNSYDEPSNLHENNQDILLDSCSCSENDVSSSCTSSEIDWEIQFTPPKYCST